MATPQWVLLQRRIQPTQKTPETQYEKNARRRQVEEIRTALKRGFLKHLDQQLILEMTSDPEVEELDQVTYISLPSFSVQSIDDLSILSCPRLCIINLPRNFISDLTPFHSCINLLKLDVSGNQIQTLPEASFWASLHSLKVLYLNNNIVSDKTSLFNLSHCSKLQVLTMYDNPVALLNNYRHIAVNCILSLKALDHHVISDQEIIENIQLTGKFRSRAKPFHRLLYLPVNKEHTLADELREVFNLLLLVDRVLAHHSPVVIIQRWVRGWLTRNKLLKSNSHELRSVVQYRERGSEHVNRILRGTPRTPRTPRGRVEIGELPLPPPSSPIPRPLSYRIAQQDLLLMDSNQGGPTDEELKKTIEETKKVLGNEKNTQETKKAKSRASVCKKKDKPVDLKPLNNDDRDVTELTILGEHQDIYQINKTSEVIDAKLREAQEIRDAESDIREMMLETRKPATPCRKERANWPKDLHAFARGHATMSLAILKEINRKQCELQRENELIKKARVVAKIKEDREYKKKRIFETQQNVKDAVIKWRLNEEKLLHERKNQMELEEENRKVKKAENIEMMVEAVKNRREKQKLALLFAQQHNMLNKRLHDEERKLQKMCVEDSYKEKVQTTRISAQEQAEVVNKFMELRQEKMRSDNTGEREKLNSVMIELASHKLMEAKQKVARVKAWKKIARSLRTEEVGDDVINSNIPTNDLSTAFDSIPEADAVDVGILGPLLQAYTNLGLTSGFTPVHMRGISNQAHRTWQRGSIELMKHAGKPHDESRVNGYSNNPHFDPHLPRLKPVSDLQPLMYDQFPPPPYFHHIGTTPDNTYQTNTPVLEPVTVIDDSGLTFPGLIDQRQTPEQLEEGTYSSTPMLQPQLAANQPEEERVYPMALLTQPPLAINQPEDESSRVNTITTTSPPFAGMNDRFSASPAANRRRGSLEVIQENSSDEQL